MIGNNVHYFCFRFSTMDGIWPAASKRISQFILLIFFFNSTNIKYYYEKVYCNWWIWNLSLKNIYIVHVLYLFEHQYVVRCDIPQSSRRGNGVKSKTSTSINFLKEISRFFTLYLQIPVTPISSRRGKIPKHDLQHIYTR